MNALAVERAVLLYERTHHTSWTCERRGCRQEQSPDVLAREYVMAGRVVWRECQAHPECDDAMRGGKPCYAHREEADAEDCDDGDCTCHCHEGGICDDCGEPA